MCTDEPDKRDKCVACSCRVDCGKMVSKSG